MAYAKCDHHGPHEGTALRYRNTPIDPIGFPNPAVLCAITGCNSPARLYLTEQEWASFNAGERVFEGPRKGIRIRVGD